MQRAAGNSAQEESILNAIKNGFIAKRVSKGISGEFFKMNDRAINALIEATKNDFAKGEIAILRRAEDQYRQVIFNSQVYAATGATYEKAIDMATKDFLAAGINCIEYANGARHTLSDYADMALRTAQKRAYLTGEGEMRQEWGISTVIMNKRTSPCPKCLPFVGKVLIDDVWSGGNAKDGNYPLMSKAIAKGLYHPRCKDSHTTYFEGISTPPDNKWSKEELEQIGANTKAESQLNYAKRQEEKYERLSKYSLDKDNKRKYKARADEWKGNVINLSSYLKNNNRTLENPSENDTIKLEMYRKNMDARKAFKAVSEEMFSKLTITARKKGAVILKGTPDVEEHLDAMDAAASNIGDVLLFRKDACISEVLEETYHFEQNIAKLNDDKEEPLRTILNEIDAKKYLIENASKYKIPRNELEFTEKQLASYQKQLERYMKEGE